MLAPRKAERTKNGQFRPRRDETAPACGGVAAARATDWRGELRRHDEREYSFVDATSFVLMRLLRIRAALAFDGDFSAAGSTGTRS